MMKHLVWVGRMEGVSYLLLMALAMPLKYLLGEPLMVQIIGAAHGGLFVWFAGLLCLASFRNSISISHANWGLIAALLPFGTFFFESRILQAYRS